MIFIVMLGIFAFVLSSRISVLDEAAYDTILVNQIFGQGLLITPHQIIWTICLIFPSDYLKYLFTYYVVIVQFDSSLNFNF